MKRINFVLIAIFIGVFGSAHASKSRTESRSLKVPSPVVDEELVVQKKSINVLGSKMAYLEHGVGDPIVFIHGNPTSSYIWRNVMPLVSSSSRTIAVDLIGMGHSAKPDITYTFEGHYRYFSALYRRT